MRQTVVDRDAVFSDDRLYRYCLTRRWGTGRVVNFIGLNPSTADETEDDPTIRRCIGFAQDWGFAGLVMTNLWAYRATNWRELRAGTPVGVLNDRHILEHACLAALVVAAWGAHVDEIDAARSPAVVQLLQDNHVTLACLGTTQHGHPKHPLYLAAITPRIGFA